MSGGRETGNLGGGTAAEGDDQNPASESRRVESGAASFDGQPLAPTPPDFKLPSSGLTGMLGGSLEEQLERALERLSFYSSFDKLIQENITRSGELMREAIDLRERARWEIEQGQRDAEGRLASEREAHGEVLASLFDQFDDVRQATDRFADRLTNALADSRGAPVEQSSGDQSLAPFYDDALPPTAFAPIRPGGGDESLAAIEPFSAWDAEQPATSVDDEAAARIFAAHPFATAGQMGSGDLTLLEGHLAEAARHQLAGDEIEEQSPAPERMEMAPTSSPRNDGEGPLALLDERSAEGVGAFAEEGTSEAAALASAWPRPVMLLVHGVPRAATALSLQRHLAGLRYVTAVEAREYAEGVLRLQVTVQRPLDVDDLVAWEGATELEAVHVEDNVIEVRLGGSSGF